MKRVKVIAFDFDGTIFDSSRLKINAFKELYKDYGEKIQTRVIDYHLKNLGINRFEKFKFFQESILFKTYDQKIGSKLSEKFNKIIEENVNKAHLIVGVEEFFKKYEGEFLFYIASAAPKEEIEYVLRKKNLSKFFKKVFGYPKLKFDVLGEILLEKKINKNELLMVGDTKADYIAANRQGVNFIGIGKNDFFSSHIKVIKNFNDLYKNIL